MNKIKDYSNGAQGWDQINHTIKLMFNLIYNYRKNPLVRRVAEEIIKNVPPHNNYEEARKIFEWVRDNIRYTRDPLTVEYLQSPDVTLQKKMGDCDDYTILIGSLAWAAGIPFRIVVMGKNKWPHHVYPELYVHENWLAADAIYPNFNFGQELIPQKVRQVYAAKDFIPNMGSWIISGDNEMNDIFFGETLNPYSDINYLGGENPVPFDYNQNHLYACKCKLNGDPQTLFLTDDQINFSKGLLGNNFEVANAQYLGDVQTSKAAQLAAGAINFSTDTLSKLHQIISQLPPEIRNIFNTVPGFAAFNFAQEAGVPFGQALAMGELRNVGNLIANVAQMYSPITPTPITNNPPTNVTPNQQNAMNAILQQKQALAQSIPQKQSLPPKTMPTKPATPQALDVIRGITQGVGAIGSMIGNMIAPGSGNIIGQGVNAITDLFTGIANQFKPRVNGLHGEKQSTNDPYVYFRFIDPYFTGDEVFTLAGDAIDERLNAVELLYNTIPDVGPATMGAAVLTKNIPSILSQVRPQLQQLQQQQQQRITYPNPSQSATTVRAGFTQENPLCTKSFLEANANQKLLSQELLTKAKELENYKLALAKEEQIKYINSANTAKDLYKAKTQKMDEVLEKYRKELFQLQQQLKLINSEKLKAQSASRFDLIKTLMKKASEASLKAIQCGLDLDRIKLELELYQKANKQLQKEVTNKHILIEKLTGLIKADSDAYQKVQQLKKMGIDILNSDPNAATEISKVYEMAKTLDNENLNMGEELETVIAERDRYKAENEAIKKAVVGF